MLKSDLRIILQTQKNQLIIDKPYVKRSSLSEVSNLPGFATIISGVRRSGKSTYLRILYQNDPAKYTYIHFDDPRLLEFSLDDFFRLEELAGETTFMFDEIQHVKEWEVYVRHLTERNRPVYITGSNASLLSGEMAGKLTGRQLSYELFPYSYSEFLSQQNQVASEDNLEEFLVCGGFPEYVRYRNTLILQSLFTDILERDIIARYQIRSSFEFKQLATYLINNIARPYSLRRLTEVLKLGSANTTSSYIEHLENAYLFYSISKFDYSWKKQSVNPKKIYAVDNGLILANTAKLQDDKGRLFENAVFIQLRRKYKNIFYFSDKGECDFVVQDPTQNFVCYQVCYELEKDNYNREIDGLVAALNFFDISKGYLITLSQSDQIKVQDKIIDIKSGIDFFSE